MSNQTNINNIIFNQLSESKYNQIIPEEGEFYVTPDTNIATKDWTESRINDIMNNLYPVGSTYITTAATCPLAILISGSTWTKVSEGRVLWGSDSSHSAGTTIEAGLPNITGWYAASDWFRDISSVQSGGALYNAANHGSRGATGASGYSSSQSVDFDASRSSSIYGNSTTVQPPAYVVNIFQRTA